MSIIPYPIFIFLKNHYNFHFVLAIQGVIIIINQNVIGIE